MAIATAGPFTVIDCPDPGRLAAFYAAVFGWQVVDRADEQWATITNGSSRLDFQAVDDYRAPEWPSQVVPQQFHLDLDVADLDVGEREVLALGATKAEYQPGTGFRVFLDPAGHPFCLVRESAD